MRLATKGAVVGTYVATPNVGYKKKGYIRLDYADQHAKRLKEFQKCIAERLGKVNIVNLASQMAGGIGDSITINGRTYEIPKYVVSKLRSMKLIDSNNKPVDGRAIIRIALAAVARSCKKRSRYTAARAKKYKDIQKALARPVTTAEATASE